MEFSNDYLQQLILPNLHSCSSTNIFGHEISPFQPQNFPHEMGNFFLPQPLDQDLNTTSTPPPNNQEVEALSLDKKHRHTKIATAQGVRDRRVRLSMGIAREFFDLQDMLGFDKPSKTLAWLFAKSRGAIQELALEKKSLGSFSFGTDEDASIGCSTSTGALVRRRRICSEFAREQSCCKSGRASGGISQAQCNKSLVARENRAKARARARERTREKLSTKAQFDHHGTSYGSSNSLLDSIGINVIKSDELSRLIGIYSQTHPNGDLHNPLAESIPSLSGWNIFTFTN